jgi:hypothetical protein
MKGKFVDQEVAPQREGGCDFSGRGKVLVRYGDMTLVWRGPRSVWSGVGMPRSYCQAKLHVVGPDMRSFGPESIIFEGGRLAMHRIAPEIPKIRELMKLPTLDTFNINLKKTFVVEEA